MAGKEDVWADVLSRIAEPDVDVVFLNLCGYFLEIQFRFEIKDGGGASCRVGMLRLRISRGVSKWQLAGRAVAKKKP